MPADTWVAPDLKGRVAVVTGASRGVGRGIAEVLGACGATVYAVARDRAGGLEAVVKAINGAGGEGIAVRCDLRDDDQTEALFTRVAEAGGGLHLLVNNALGWGDPRPGDDGPIKPLPLWRQTLWWWDANVTAGVRMPVAACRFGIPLMLETEGQRLVLFTSERAGASPDEVWDVALDARAHAISRLAAVLGAQLGKRGIAAAVFYPGWTRTEDMEASVLAGTYPAAKTLEELREKTVSPQFAGRGVARLLTDPRLVDRSGGTVIARQLALELGFTDVDGRVPQRDG